MKQCGDLNTNEQNENLHDETTDRQDADLLHSILTYPEEGIKTAIELYGGSISTICKNILCDYDSQKVSEAVSSCFIKLWLHAKQYDKEKGCSLKSWLYSIARNTALDIRRRDKHSMELIPLEEVELGETDDIDNDFIRHRNAKILHDTVDDMDEPDRTIFIMRYYSYCSIDVIAEKLDLTSNHVAYCLKKGKKQLKNILLERGIIYDEN